MVEKVRQLSPSHHPTSGSRETVFMGKTKKKRFAAYYRVSTRKQGHSGLGIKEKREAVAR
jgi:hypothetical protein